MPYIGNNYYPFIYKGNDLIYPNPVKNGLALWYDFLGIKNTELSKDIAKDLSNNSNNGSLKNFSFSSESGYNKGLVLDGVDDSVLIGSNPSISDLNLEVTVEVSLIFKETPTFWRWLIGNVSDSAGNTGYSLAYSPQSSQALTFIAGGTVITTGYIPQENEKMHVVGLIDKDKNISLFINGVKTKSTKSIKNLANSSLPLNIGKASYYESPFLKANIISARIYNRALLDEEILNNYKIEKERLGL